MEEGPKKDMPHLVPGHTHLLLTGQDLVTWLALGARQAGKCSLLSEQYYTQLKLERSYEGSWGDGHQPLPTL